MSVYATLPFDCLSVRQHGTDDERDALTMEESEHSNDQQSLYNDDADDDDDARSQRFRTAAADFVVGRALGRDGGTCRQTGRMVRIDR